MPGTASLLHRRCLGCVGILTLALVSGDFVTAGAHEDSGAEGDSGERLHACVCADGRQFALGASLFGKNSSRVVITGFSPELPASGDAGQLPQCMDLIVVGQVVGLAAAEDARPFLRRENRKQGTLVNVCDTRIRFVKAKKSYDFFADDGGVLTLSDEDKVSPSVSEERNDGADSAEAGASETGLNQDLTGRDLLRLTPAAQARDDPAASPFNEDDLKDGAYFIVRKRVKVQPASDDDQGQGITRAQNGPQNEVNVPAGTLGRIEKGGGFRSEPLWIADIYPDSVPLPFWRSLLSGPKGFERRAVPPRKVILPSSEIVEINHFFDQYGVEWTRFGEDVDENDKRQKGGTTRLPEIYSPAELPIDENISIAQKAGMFDAIRRAAVGLSFSWKQPNPPVGPGALVLEERDHDRPEREALPDLSRRQCFIDSGTFPFALAGRSSDSRPALFVNDTDVRVFQPKDSAQESQYYYAIDLELKLGSRSGGSNGVIVCRFPSAAIDLSLLGMAERILVSRFDIDTRKTK
jgi:hypothetical protein